MAGRGAPGSPISRANFHPRRSRSCSLWPLAGRLVVTLSCMSDIKHVVLIHGMSGCGDYLAPAGTAFEERGYTVHIPTLRHHELPLEEGATKIASLSLREYADDLVKLVDSLDSAALLVGHSMGGLLAQLVAGRTRHAGVVAACTSPTAGIYAISPMLLRLGLRHFLQPRPVGQACVSPYVGTVSKVNRKCPNRGACPRAVRRTGLRLRASDVRGRLPMAGPRQSRHCQLLSDHNAGACDCGVRAIGFCCRAWRERRQPAISRRPTLRFPAQTTWCFPERRYLSPWATSTTGSRENYVLTTA